MKTRRKLRCGASLLLAWAVLLAGLGSAEDPASASGDQNLAVAVNTKDGSSVFRLSFSLRRVKGDVVDPVNVAIALASCESCQTVAIAIQAVLVSSEPSVVSPVNLALAFNQDCTACQTLASAYQFVLGTGGPTRLTPQGRRRVSEVRRQLRELRGSGLTIEQIQARTDQLASELQHVLSEQLVPAGRPSEPAERSGVQTTGDDGASAVPAAEDQEAPAGAPAETPPDETSGTETAPSATSNAPDEDGSAGITDAPEEAPDDSASPPPEQETTTTGP
jgi:putative peptide zinc metalloprotease protein